MKSMERKFKTGDKVCLKSDLKEVRDKFPMVVRRYEAEAGSFQASVGKDYYGYDITKLVQCDWRDANGCNCEHKYLEDELDFILD